MEYTNDMLHKMRDRQFKNVRFSKYYFQYAQELGLEMVKCSDGNMYPKFNDKKSHTLYNNAVNLHDCLHFWQWDVYDAPKIMDLKHVNRCKNTRFCPNCKVLENAKYMHKITPIYGEYLNRGYYFYFLTLTVPSLKTDDPVLLKNFVDDLYACFSKLKKLYSLDAKSKNAYCDRLVTFSGGIRVLEITHNYKNGYHPHLHCIIVTDYEIDPGLLVPKYKGKHRAKNNSYIYKNEIEMQLCKVWSLLWYDVYSVYNMEHYDYDPAAKNPVICGELRDDMKNLEIDFRELDPDGFMETFKYTVKSSEITSYKVFRCFQHVLYRRRVRQGFGIFYRLNIDDCIDDDGVADDLPAECDGVTSYDLIVKNIDELYTTYREYKKISRFDPSVTASAAVISSMLED